MEPAKKRPAAQVFKDKGNEAFKSGNFQAAVEHYTSAIKADPSDHILPCNRALARLKLNQWKLAEADCTKSLELVPQPNCKALFRRGTARRHLNKWDDALQDLMAALALEPNNTSISAELETVKSHIQDKATSENASLPAAEAPLSTSTASSDSETSSANQPTAGPSSSAALLDGRSSNNLMKEVSTKRFTSSHPKTISSNLAPGGTSFGDLKQIRQKKEEKSSGLMSSRNHITRIDAEKMRKSSPSSTNSAIPPIKNFSDFEMRWGMSSQPELRCSILETLDHHRVDHLFGEHLEPETLEQMIDAMQVSLKSNDKARIRKAVELLQGLDHVPRIGTLTLFLEPDHQKVIREILLTFQNLEPGKYIKLNNWNI